MKSYDATATIQASPEAIWAILTDAPGYQVWDSGVERVEGAIAPGETIRSSPRPTRAGPSRSR
jgi:Polyketide cyclase / dehydrase and lipid transport